MCYSLNSSVGTFLIAMATVFFMYMRKTKMDLYLIPLIFTYGFIQFAEGLMWYDSSCGTINKMGTYLAYINLSLHVFAFGLGIYIVEKKMHGVIIGLLVSLYYLLTMPRMECSKYKDNTMYWGFYLPGYCSYVFPLCVLLCIYSSIPFRYKILVPLWYSLCFFYFFWKQGLLEVTQGMKFLSGKYKPNLVGSLWCHIASFTAPGLYLIQYVI